MRFTTYRNRGVNALYIKSSERKDYLKLTENLVQELIESKSISHPDTLETISELSRQSMDEIFRDKSFDDSTLQRTQYITQVHLEALSTQVDLVVSLLSLIKRDTYQCRHAITTSIFTILLAQSINEFNEEDIFTLGLAGLLHDIGLSLLPPNINESRSDLTKKEIKDLHRHPKISSEMVANVHNPLLSQTLLEHHEAWNGTGYPQGLKGTEISLSARIVAIADAFTGLIIGNDDILALNYKEALSFLYFNKGLDPDLVKEFSQLLNPSD